MRKSIGNRAVDNEEVWPRTNGVVAELATVRCCGEAVDELWFFLSHCEVRVRVCLCRRQRE